MKKKHMHVRMYQEDYNLLKSVQCELNEQAQLNKLEKRYSLPDVVNLNLRKLRNRRGSLVDIAVIMIFLAVMAIVLVFSNQLYKEGIDDINETFSTEENASSRINASILNDARARQVAYPSMMDNIFVFVMVGLALASIIGASMIRTMPVIFIISIVLLAVIGLVGAEVANFYYDVAVDDSDVNTFAMQMPKAYFVMENYVLFIVVIGLAISLALFAKVGGGQQ